MSQPNGSGYYIRGPGGGLGGLEDFELWWCEPPELELPEPEPPELELPELELPEPELELTEPPESVCFVGAGGAARAIALSIPFTCLAGCATAFTV